MVEVLQSSGLHTGWTEIHIEIEFQIDLRK